MAKPHAYRPQRSTLLEEYEARPNIGVGKQGIVSTIRAYAGKIHDFRVNQNTGNVQVLVAMKTPVYSTDIRGVPNIYGGFDNTSDIESTMLDYGDYLSDSSVDITSERSLLSPGAMFAWPMPLESWFDPNKAYRPPYGGGPIYWGAPRDGGRRPHAGIDVYQTFGHPVYASQDGVVYEIKKTDESTAGKWVVIQHKLGNSVYYTRYLHLDSVNVSKGERVSMGDFIGTNGNTGTSKKKIRSGRAHVHFEIRKSYGTAFPGSLNPIDLLLPADSSYY